MNFLNICPVAFQGLVSVFSEDSGGFKEVRIAGSNRFHQSWYLSDDVVNRVWPIYRSSLQRATGGDIGINSYKMSKGKRLPP